jgi:hypothetical protein
MYYAYKVVAVSRWGVEGQSAKAQVHVLATLKPPTPQLVSIVPGVDGGISLTWQVLDESQYISKYMVHRKLLQIDVDAMVKQFSPSLPADAVKTISYALKHGIKLDTLTVPNVQLSAQTITALTSKFETTVRDLSINQTNYQSIGEVSAVGTVLDASGNMTYNDKNNLVPDTLYSYVVVAQDSITGNPHPVHRFIQHHISALQSR